MDSLFVSLRQATPKAKRGKKAEGDDDKGSRQTRLHGLWPFGLLLCEGGRAIRGGTGGQGRRMASARILLLLSERAWRCMVGDGPWSLHEWHLSRMQVHGTVTCGLMGPSHADYNCFRMAYRLSYPPKALGSARGSRFLARHRLWVPVGCPLGKPGRLPGQTAMAFAHRMLCKHAMSWTGEGKSTRTLLDITCMHAPPCTCTQVDELSSEPTHRGQDIGSHLYGVEMLRIRSI